MSKLIRKKPAPGVANEQRTVLLQHRQVTTHSGPLPSPQDLAEYERSLPGAAERIIAMAERQQNHRIECEKLELTKDIGHRTEVVALQKIGAKAMFRSDSLGQVLGFIVALLCVSAAIYCAIVLSNTVSTGLFLGLPVLGLVNAFTSGKSKKNT